MVICKTLLQVVSIFLPCASTKILTEFCFGMAYLLQLHLSGDNTGDCIGTFIILNKLCILINYIFYSLKV